jgi:hypothetical protein
MSEHHAPAADRVLQREDESFAQAAEADMRLRASEKITFGDWLVISEGLINLRHRAMRESGSNSAYGLAYTRQYAKLRDLHPWASHFDPKTTAHCIWLAENVAAVTRWRDALHEDLRRLYITPRTVKDKYLLAMKVLTQKAGTEAPSPQRALKDQMIRLQEENDMLRRRSAAGFMPGTKATDLAERIAEHHRPDYLRELARALADIAHREERQDAIEAKAKPKRAVKRA